MGSDLIFGTLRTQQWRRIQNLNPGLLRRKVLKIPLWSYFRVVFVEAF